MISPLFLLVVTYLVQLFKYLITHQQINISFFWTSKIMHADTGVENTPMWSKLLKMTKQDIWSQHVWKCLSVPKHTVGLGDKGEV